MLTSSMVGMQFCKNNNNNINSPLSLSLSLSSSTFFHFPPSFFSVSSFLILELFHKWGTFFSQRSHFMLIHSDLSYFAAIDRLIFHLHPENLVFLFSVCLLFCFRFLSPFRKLFVGEMLVSAAKYLHFLV